MTERAPPRIDQYHRRLIVDEKKTSEEPPTGSVYDSCISVMHEVDYDALADRCIMLSKKHPDRAVFVGIAGTPGSGKSFISEQVMHAINRHPSHDNNALCAIFTMDGYHLSRAQLKEKTEKGDMFKTDETGHVEFKQMTFDEVMQRRGASFTFSPEQFVHDLHVIRKNREGSFPGYSRAMHDPVPDQIHIHRHNKIILVEGLYLLSFDDPDWQSVQEIWDDRWYIDVSMTETRRRLVKRHLENWSEDQTRYWGGDDGAAAARKAEANDLKNARCIQKNSRHNAQLIISNERVLRNDGNKIQHVQRHGYYNQGAFWWALN